MNLSDVKGRGCHFEKIGTRPCSSRGNQATILINAKFCSYGRFRDAMWKVFHVVGCNLATKVQLNAKTAAFLLGRLHHGSRDILPELAKMHRLGRGNVGDVISFGHRDSFA